MAQFRLDVEFLDGLRVWQREFERIAKNLERGGTAYVWTQVPYGVPVEFGSRNRAGAHMFMRGMLNAANPAAQAAVREIGHRWTDDGALQEMVNVMAREAAEAIRQLTPVDTGALMRSIAWGEELPGR